MDYWVAVGLVGIGTVIITIGAASLPGGGLAGAVVAGAGAAVVALGLFGGIERAVQLAREGDRRESPD